MLSDRSLGIFRGYCRDSHNACDGVGPRRNCRGCGRRSPCAIMPARQLHKLSLKASTEWERQEYLSDEALCDVIAGRAAKRTYDGGTAHAALNRAHTLWVYLAQNGYNDRMKSQARRSLTCFFQYDRTACASLFPVTATTVKRANDLGPK